MSDDVSVPDSDLIPTPEAAAIIGVPEPEFTRLVNVLALRPARPGTKTTSRMWPRSLAEQLRDGPEGQELREAVARKGRLNGAYGVLEQEYPQWHDALRPAAGAMFQFNRWIKHSTFSKLRQRELYNLKNGFIEMLYEIGLCRELLLHRVILDTADDDEEDGEDVTQVREFLAFTFDIHGQFFEWHQPRRAVAFEFALTGVLEREQERADWKPRQGPKKVTLTAEEFFQAEALIRWVIRKRDQEKELARKEASQRRREQMRAEGLARQAELRQQRDAEGSDAPAE